MATMKMSSLVTPNPCNPAMEQRNWDGLRTILQKLDEIIVINVDDVTNEITYDLNNINDITMEGDLNVGGDTTIEHNLNVTQDVTIGGDMEVTNVTINENLTVDGTTTVSVLYATTINSTYVNATYVDSYLVTTNTIIACHYYDCDGNELCPPACGSGSGSGGGGGTCCGVDMSTIETLNVTVSGAVSGTGVLNYITPPGGGACRDYTGEITLSSTCGGEIMQLSISLSCPTGGSSAADLLVSCSGGGGSCVVSGGPYADAGATASPVEVTVTFKTSELSASGCPCGDDQDITIVITE